MKAIGDFIAENMAEAEANPALRLLVDRDSPPFASPVLTPREAVTAWDAERLRQIRNSCRDYMTGHPAEITPAEQAAWWASEERRAWRIWLFEDAWGTPVGFGLIRPVGGRWWATLGLLPEWRGRGHGTAIYRHLIAQCPGDLHIDVLLTNVASARAAERAGFRLEDWTGVLATLVARKGER